MKKIIVLFLVGFVLFFNSNVYAICDSSYINRLKSIARNVEITYEHNIYGDLDSDDSEAMIVSVFDFMVSGLTDELYVMDDNQNRYYSTDAVDGIINFVSFSGQRKIYIYSKVCSDKVLDTRTFDLPVFNFNSISDECKKDEFKELDICAEFIDKDEIIQGDEFEEKIELENEKKFVDRVIDFIKDNALIILLSFIAVIVLVVIISFKHHKRSALE